jgi:hypothetical protein
MGASAAGGASCIEVVRHAGGVVAAAVASAGGIGGSAGWVDGLAGPAQHEMTKSLRVCLVARVTSDLLSHLRYLTSARLT